MREEARLREADDTDSHHIAVAKFMQKVLVIVVIFLCLKILQLGLVIAALLIMTSCYLSSRVNIQMGHR